MELARRCFAKTSGQLGLLTLTLHIIRASIQVQFWPLVKKIGLPGLKATKKTPGETLPGRSPKPLNLKEKSVW